MKLKRILFYALIALSALWLLFIWWNSTRTGNDSGAMSGSVTALINSYIQKIFPSLEVSHHFVRKAAHFCEFGVLSVLLEAVLWLFLSLKSRLYSLKKRAGVLLCVPFCTVAALIDEGIQLFAEGRGSSLVDVMIDTLGAFCFALVFFGVLMLIKKLKSRSEKNDQ